MLGRQTDVAAIHAGLTGWFRARREAGADCELSSLESPKAGFSNETFLAELATRDGTRRLVIRLEPVGFRVFPEYDLPRQARIMQCLADSPVPVPRVLWVEEDRRWIGVPFYVMERIEGEVPSEVPVYHTFGFCCDATPAERAQMWRSGIETLAAIHAVDWHARGLGFLGVPPAGTGPLDQQLAYYEHYLGWVGGPPQPILRAALAWLRDHRYTPRRVTLCWGDSRFVNMIFRDGRTVGVLDWEMAFLGDPEADLVWWILLDWAQSEGYEIPRLPGFPGAEETIRRYEAVAGVPVEHALYQEVFGAFRFGVIMAKIALRLKEIGGPAPSENFETDNVCTRRLAQLLGLRGK